MSYRTSIAGAAATTILNATAWAQAVPPPEPPRPPEPAYWLGTGLTAFIIGLMGLAVLIAVLVTFFVRRNRTSTKD